MFTLLEFDEVVSTSSLLKEHYASLPHFTIIRTNYQTGGRGQFDRLWDAEKDKNVLMSLLLKDLKMNQIEPLKKIIVDTILHVLSIYGIESFFKSPNDIYVGHDKICGILIETKSSDDHLDYVVVGIGLNINQQTFGPYPATSMSLLLNREIEVKQVFNKVINQLEKALKGVSYES